MIVYIAPLSLVVYGEPGKEVPCDMNRFVTIKMFGKIQQVDQLTGHVKIISNGIVHNLTFGCLDTTSLVDLHVRPFRNIIITDGENERQMMWEILKSQSDKWKAENPTEGTKIYTESPLENFQQLWSSMFEISGWKVWISIVGVYVSALMSLKVYDLWLRFNLWRVSRTYRMNPEQGTRHRTVGERVARVRFRRSHSSPNLRATGEGIEQDDECRIELERSENSDSVDRSSTRTPRSLARRWVNLFRH